MEKLFLAVWGRGYSEPDIKLIGTEKFSEDLGYEKEDIEKVNELELHEMTDLTDLSGVHFVYRIK